MKANKIITLVVVLLTGCIMQIHAQIKALEFTGGSNPNGAKIYVPHSQADFSDFQSTSLTFELWLKFMSSDDAVLISTRSSSGGNEGFDWRLDAGWAGGRLVGGGSTLWPGLSGSIQDVWTHLALVINETATIIYKNGEEVFTGTLSNNIVPTSGDLYIGASPMVWAEGEFFQGQMTNIRIWNTARSQSEITENMNMIFSTPKTNLIANWTFQEGLGTVLNDDAHPATIVPDDDDNQTRINWIVDSGLELTIEPTTNVNSIAPETIQVFRSENSFNIMYSKDVNRIMLYDVNGQCIANYQVNASGHFNLPVRDLKKGVYILKTNIPNQTIKIVR